MEERAPTKRAKRHLGGEAPRSPAEVRTAPGRAGRREEEPIGRTAADHSIMAGRRAQGSHADPRSHIACSISHFTDFS